EESENPDVANDSSSGEATEAPFIDLWDYDILKLKIGSWVAVAYDQEFYIGLIEKLMKDKVKVSFLENVASRRGIMKWPVRPDVSLISPKYIFKLIAKDDESRGTDKSVVSTPYSRYLKLRQYYIIVWSLINYHDNNYAISLFQMNMVKEEGLVRVLCPLLTA
ncbi:hypothetical protein AC249_AIPGENE6922, partial [Exaiptasia diaphana]